MQLAWIDRARGLLRGERVASAQSYDDAREQLDGAAWREVPKSTDAWFVVDEPDAPVPVTEQLRRRRIPVIAGTAFALLFTSGVVLWAAHRPPPPVATSVASAPEPTQVPPVPQAMPHAAASALPTTTTAAPPERALALAAASPVKKVRAKHSRRHH